MTHLFATMCHQVIPSDILRAEWDCPKRMDKECSPERFVGNSYSGKTKNCCKKCLKKIKIAAKGRSDTTGSEKTQSSNDNQGSSQSKLLNAYEITGIVIGSTVSQ